jgi:hypothetical protein
LNCQQAEDNLIDLLIETLDYDIPILFSVLGYSMMEMGIIDEAIWCFGTAVSMENDYRLAIDNFCTCVYIWVYVPECHIKYIFYSVSVLILVGHLNI